MFQQYPVVRRMLTHASTSQRSPEHVNVLNDGGGSYTSVQLCISGTGGRAHPGESTTISNKENVNACQHTPEVPRACEYIVWKGGVATHQCSYACQVLGAGHIQGNVSNLDLNA